MQPLFVHVFDSRKEYSNKDIKKDETAKNQLKCQTRLVSIGRKSILVLQLHLCVIFSRPCYYTHFIKVKINKSIEHCKNMTKNWRVLHTLRKIWFDDSNISGSTKNLPVLNALWTFVKLQYTLFYRQIGCLAFSLRFWPKIKQLLSNCPASDWTFSFKTGDFCIIV